MAQLNIDELLSDPDLVDVVTQIARVPRVNSLGENTLIETPIQTVGSVQPASGRAIMRLPEAFRVANVYSFWIKGTIVATAPGKYSDILIFNGLRFQVQTVMDWSNFGEGYCEGTCVAEVPS
jgi:hypothetical protein